MLLVVSGGRALPRSTAVFVGDRLIPAECWPYTFPKKGALVTVKVSVHGSDMVRTVALIGVAAAALYISGGALGPGGVLGAQGLGASFAAGGFGANVAALATMGVGMLAINSLLPISSPKFASTTESAVLSISGSRNVERPFSPVPQILGFFQYTPPLSATPFTDLDGADQFLTQRFVSGYGPLDISNLRIGKTPIEDFTDIETEINEGFSDDTPITLYPGDVQQDVYNIRIYNGTWRQKPEDPHPDANPCTQPGVTGTENCYVRVTPMPCYKFRVDIAQPHGGIRIKDQGDRLKMQVDTEVWYRVTGTTDDYVLGGTHTSLEKTTTLVRYSIEVTPAPPADGVEVGYDVLVKRLTLDDREGLDPDSDNTRYSQTNWTSLTASSEGSPVTSTQPCLSELAIRIKASGQLNGTVDDFNFLGKTICLDYTGTPGLWTKRATNNPASLFRLVLQGGANKSALDDCRIDIPALEAWHDFCSARGFTFNMVRDFASTVSDTLRDVANAGRARYDQIDGLWTVLVDNQDNYVIPVQLFTPRNSWGFSSVKQFLDVPHAFRCRFVDADADYAQTEISVYAEGYDETTATRYESVEFPGLTNSTEITCMGKYQLAQVYHRQMRYSWSCDIEHIVCTQGDSVLLQNDSIQSPAVGGGAARIKSISGNDVTLDSLVQVPTTPAIVNRSSADGAIRTDAVSATDGTPAGGYTDTFSYTSLPSGVSVGNLVTVGELSSETLHLVIDTISPMNDEAAVITAYDVAPETDVVCA